MAALNHAIDLKRKMYFEFENTPFYCSETEVSTPTARAGRR
jgi:elongation factor P